MFIVKNIFTIISNVKKESQRRDRKATTKQLYESWFMQILYVILKMLQHIVFLCFMYNALV